MSGHGIFLRVGAFFSKIFSTKYNPFYHLGTLAIYFFAIAFVSGIYLFLFYKVDPTQSYISTDGAAAGCDRDLAVDRA